MADKDPRDIIPDLVVPPPRTASKASMEAVRPPSNAGMPAVRTASNAGMPAVRTASNAGMPAVRTASNAGMPAVRTASNAGMAAVRPPAQESVEQGDFGMELERGGAMSASSSGGRAAQHAVKQVSIEIAGHDDFDMELERGGAMIAQAPASSGRPMATRSSGASPSGSLGLDVAYRRTDAKPDVDAGPSPATKMLARVLPLVFFVAALTGLARFVHRAGGRNVMKLVPHAFDASSTAQSGGVAGGALVVAIAVGFIGLKIHPRSYTMLASAAALVITSLAMVTVALVSTDEHPGPADGALLIPYVLPLAVLLLGFGVAGRGPTLFLRGGAARLGGVIAALGGGAIVFAAVEISALASRLP